MPWPSAHEPPRWPTKICAQASARRLMLSPLAIAEPARRARTARESKGEARTLTKIGEREGTGDGISLRSSDTKPRERLLFSPLEDEPAIENLPEPIALTANYQQFARRSRDRAAAVAVRDRAQFELHLQGQGGRRKAGGARVGRALCARRKRAEGRQPGADYGPADRYGDRLPYLGRPVASSVVGAIEPRLRFAE